MSDKQFFRFIRMQLLFVLGLFLIPLNPSIGIGFIILSVLNTIVILLENYIAKRNERNNINRK